MGKVDRNQRRNSNIELLRIISIFLIILGHFCLQTDWEFSHTSYLLESLIHTFWIGGKLGVDIFVLITGYFLVCARFKIHSFFKVWLEAYFYGVLVYAFALYMGIISLNLKDTIKTFLLSSTGYLNWFVTAYLVMVALSPFLNILLRNLTKRNFQVMLGIFVFLAILKTLFHNPSIGSTGNDSIWLIVIYCFGAYIRLFEDDLKSISIGRYRIGLMLTLGMSVASVFCLDAIQRTYHISSNPLFYGRFIDGFSPIQLLSAVFIFIIVIYKRPVHIYLVNKIASTTFAIYLIHANLLIVPWLWNSVVRANRFEKSYFVLIYGVGAALSIFIICSLIDLVRQAILGRTERALLNILSEKSKDLMEFINSRWLGS